MNHATAEVPKTTLVSDVPVVGLPQAVASATYDAANQMLTFGSQTLAYDANRNLTGDGSKTYTWNARNQLLSTTGASFGYDGLGRRLQKTVGGATTDFLYDGINPVQELSGGTPVANLLTGFGIDEYFTRGSETLLTNALGSTVALTDSSGTVQTCIEGDRIPQFGLILALRKQ